MLIWFVLDYWNHLQIILESFKNNIIMANDMLAAADNIWHLPAVGL